VPEQVGLHTRLRPGVEERYDESADRLPVIFELER